MAAAGILLPAAAIISIFKLSIFKLPGIHAAARDFQGRSVSVPADSFIESEIQI
jgi:hypothetical protein